MKYFVTAIDTDSGKTLVSAILVKMLGADYWKPVQSGEPRDTETVQHLVGSHSGQFYAEKYLLNTPASPHYSAQVDGVKIKLEEIIPPISNRDLVIEGAGGILVPLNDQDVVIDIAKKVNAEVVLVSNIYLGSINHTLLTIEELKRRGLKIKGVIFNGEENKSTEEIILKKTGLKKLMRIDKEESINQEVVEQYAEKLKKCWD